MASDEKPTKTSEERYLRVVEFIAEAIAWVQIAAAPFLIGVVLGAVIYIAEPSTEGMILGVCVAGVGLLVGALWATNEWKGKGTVWFMSRLTANPELYEKDDDGSEDDAVEEEEVPPPSSY